MADWWSIEVCDGETPATGWRASYGEALVEAAVGNGASNWAWHEFPWGVVLEVEFGDEEAWERFRNLPLIQATLDAVPDPVNGIFVYRGRGGSAGVRNPRRPKPSVGADAISLPELGDDDPIDLTNTVLPEVVREMAGSVRRPAPERYASPTGT